MTIFNQFPIKSKLNKANNNKKALVIAISSYEDSSNLNSIELCRNDGNEMYDVLIKLGYEITDNRKLIGYVNSTVEKSYL